jgi:hypothetical protein
MLLACWVSARLVVRRFAITTPGDRMRMGALAFALLIVAELLGSLALRGMSPGHCGSPGAAGSAKTPGQC